jgi:2-deoxy-D-gluconate 3-dehydrogenase
MEQQPLAGQVALVTGARFGIGRAAALALAEAGADVVVTSRRGDDLEAVLRAVQARGRRAAALALDLREAPAVAQWGRLDILVNNAAVSYPAPALETTPQAWAETLAVNLGGPFWMACAACEHMREHGGGRIINISSTFAFTAPPGRAAYAASKAALNQLTKVLAVEWAPYGIRVNAVAPCATRTESREALFADPDRQAQIIARIPLGRIPTPDDVVGAVVFLAGPAAGFVTGHVLLVDGGWTAA